MFKNRSKGFWALLMLGVFAAGIALVTAGYAIGEWEAGGLLVLVGVFAAAVSTWALVGIAIAGFVGLFRRKRDQSA